MLPGTSTQPSMATPIRRRAQFEKQRHVFSSPRGIRAEKRSRELKYFRRNRQMRYTALNKVCDRGVGGSASQRNA